MWTFVIGLLLYRKRLILILINFFLIDFISLIYAKNDGLSFNWYLPHSSEGERFGWLSRSLHSLTHCLTQFFFSQCPLRSTINFWINRLEGVSPNSLLKRSKRNGKFLHCSCLYVLNVLLLFFFYLFRNVSGGLGFASFRSLYSLLVASSFCMGNKNFQPTANNQPFMFWRETLWGGVSFFLQKNKRLTTMHHITLYGVAGWFIIQESSAHFQLFRSPWFRFMSKLHLLSG